MDMRLAYRIVSMPIRVSTLAGKLHHSAAERFALQANCIQRIPKIIFDDVATFYAEHDRTIWDMMEDIPNWAPPFESFFVEWNQPKWFLIDGKVVEEKVDAQVGLLVTALDVGHYAPNELDTWMNLMAALVGVSSIGCENKTMIGEFLSKSKWLVHSSQWMTTNVKPTSGLPFFTGIDDFLFVDASGRLLEHVLTGASLQNVINMNDEKKLCGAMHILGLGLSFMHCKNVSTVEHEDNRGRRFHEREKIPVLKFHTLDINPMKKVLRTEGKSEETGIKKALHICRGHFATYTPDHPLFGKYVGTYWRPDHVRGASPAGIVTKDYKVNV